MSKEKKLSKKTIIGLFFLVLFAGITVLGIIYYDELYLETGWFQSAPTGNAFINKFLALMPHLLGSVHALFVALIVLYVLGIVFKRIFRGTPRRVTIGKLVASIVRVVVWAAAVIAVLAAWGFNVGALIASAGVLTLIVGLGMQSLIADVVAGIFLVCDGAIEVGEVITIDGWRGTVQEIGIRTTKLINYSGDIRVCNNNTITTFINQSRVRSYPMITVGISYKENIPKIEKLFAEHKEELKKQLPLVLEGPDYLGVGSLSDSSVDLQFGAYCKEDDFYQVQRDMRGVIKTFLEENGVSIPFPQVVIHNAETEVK